MDSDFRIEGFSLPHLIVIIIIIGFAVFIFYWLWTYPCADEVPEPGVVFLDSRHEISASQREPTRSACCRRDKAGEELCVLYATEIEPGTIVLQSPNGELFRVLRELDAAASGRSLTSGLPPGTAHPVHYIPSYTRPHLLTQPSAPPPAYSHTGDGSAAPLGYSGMPDSGLGPSPWPSSGLTYGERSGSTGDSSLPGEWRPLYINSGSQY